MRIILTDRSGFEKFMEVPDEEISRSIKIPVLGTLTLEEMSGEDPTSVPMDYREFFSCGICARL